jgi:DNA polymerase-3 subunit beta
MNLDELISPTISQNSQNFAIIIGKQALLKAISHVQAIVEKKNIINILSHIKLSAQSDGLLSLTATDMEIEVHEVVPAEIVTPGDITVSAANLFDIVRKLPDHSLINLSVDQKINKLKISAANCNFLLSYLQGDNFPSIDYGDRPYNLSILAADLIKMIDCTKVAISLDDNRYNISGMFFHVLSHEDNSYLRAVATDGQRLILVEIPLQEQIAQMPGIIIPRKTIIELRKLLENTQTLVEISFSGNKIIFSFENIKLISKLLDGTFPDYEEFIPQDNKIILNINRKTLVEAIDRVSVVAFEKLKTVKLSLSTNSLKLNSTGSANDSASDELVVAYEDQELSLGFYAKYLLELLQAMPGEEISCYFHENLDEAVLFKDLSDNGLIFVMMPMEA